MHKLLLICTIVLGITSCSNYPETPEELVIEFSELLSSGNCEEAMELATDNAKMTLQGSIDAGCDSFESKVDSVDCNLTGNTGICICYETRKEYGSFAFPYEVILEDDKWKVKNNTKDTGMDEGMFEE